MISTSTRRFEMGLPLFSGLDLGLMLEAQAQIKRKEFQGMSAFVETLGKTGKLLTVRKLSAIYRATDNELKMAETDPTWMAKFEDQAAERPFRETFEDAMSFHAALWESLGVSPVSSAPAEPPAGKGKKSKTSGGSRSGA